MAYYRITFGVVVPDDTPEADVREWVEFNLHIGACSGSNPLVDVDLDAVAGTVRII